MAFPAFLDACVLVPINLTDVLLRLAGAKTYRPLWSPHVLAEVERTLLSDRLNVSEDGVAKRLRVMREHFPDAEVSGYEALIPDMTCHEKDRHVLAAAVRANAEVIVTANTSDFPDASLIPYDITAIHPDDFLLDQLDLYPGKTIQCLKELVNARRKPPRLLMTSLPSCSRRFRNSVSRHTNSHDLWAASGVSRVSHPVRPARLRIVCKVGSLFGQLRDDNGRRFSRCAPRWLAYGPLGTLESARLQTGSKTDSCRELYEPCAG